jgi:hypothetical protein
LGTDDAASAAALAMAIGKQPQLLAIADTLSTHFDGVSVAQNEVRGSVRVKDKEFDAWLAAVYARLSDSRPDGENVARVDGAR